MFAASAIHISDAVNSVIQHIYTAAAVQQIKQACRSEYYSQYYGYEDVLFVCHMKRGPDCYSPLKPSTAHTTE